MVSLVGKRNGEDLGEAGPDRLILSTKIRQKDAPLPADSIPSSSYCPIVHKYDQPPGPQSTMGCNQSKSEKPSRPTGVTVAATVKDTAKAHQPPTSPLAPGEIEKRIVCTKEAGGVKTTFGGVSVRYAYLSQRGYYPDDLNKKCQDCYSVAENFAERDTDGFFGVYDGHGGDGAECANFVAETLPTLLAVVMNKSREIELKGQEDVSEETKQTFELSDDKLAVAIEKTHVACNMRLRAAKLDDSFSGTTSISIYLHGRTNKITVSNVGDSRAICGRAVVSGEKGEGDAPLETPASTLEAVALSYDQTPYRRDERIRIRKHGGRILTHAQLLGKAPINEPAEDGDVSSGQRETIEEKVLGEVIDEEGDPPRVWSPRGDYPGAAVTRSIGDELAEVEAGVIAIPEVLTYELTARDKIIFLASDGVFEFMTNQEVIDICSNFTDPVEACRKVANESYEKWIKKERRTDDITMICIFVDDL